MSSFGSSFASAYNARTAGRESASRTRLAWAQLAEEQEERDKREAHLGKAADSFFKGMPQALSELGISETQFANMSASEKSAAAQGYMQAQTQKQIYQQLAAQQQAQADDQAAFGAVQRASTRTTTVPSPTMPGAFADLNVQTTGTPTAAGVWAELAANPRALRSPVAQPFLRELAQSGATPDEASLLNARANMMNAQANFSRADRANRPAPAVQVPGYTPVPDNNGGWRYLRTQPSAQQQMEIQRLSDKAANLRTQIASWDAELRAGKTTSGWKLFGGRSYADLKAQAQRELDEVTARLADLQSGATPGTPAATPGTPPAAPASRGDGDLWQEFLNSQK